MNEHVALGIGLCIQVLGLVLHNVGMATAEWSVVDYNDITCGLWKVCRGSRCTEWTTESEVFGDSFDERLKIVRGFAITGLAVAAVDLMLLIPAFFKGKTGFQFHYVAGGMAIFAFAAILVCDVVWAAGLHQDITKYADTSIRGSSLFVKVDLGYSFALSLTGAVVILLGGIVTCLKNMMVRGDSPPAELQPMATMNSPPLSDGDYTVISIGSSYASTVRS